MSEWTDEYDQGKPSIEELQAEIDVYRNMLNEILGYTVIPDSVSNKISDLLLNKGE